MKNIKYTTPRAHYKIPEYENKKKRNLRLYNYYFRMININEVYY